MKEAPVVQWIERQIPVLNVGGSSPFGRTKKKPWKVLSFNNFPGFFYFLKLGVKYHGDTSKYISVVALW